jgi:DNA-binding CsgD family transcriptional regulator
MSVQTTAAVPRPLADLLERESECERVQTLIRSSNEGAGAALLIVGPPGIGKTALAVETVRGARLQGMLTLTASGTELERDYALGLVRQLLERIVREMPPADRSELTQGAGEVAQAALGLTTRPRLDTSDGGFSVLHGLYWVTADLAARRPLALVVDDAHWGDELSIRFLAFLTQRIEELPIVLAMTARTAEAAADPVLAGLELDPTVHTIRPGPLSARACGTLVRRAFDAAPAPEFVTACHRATAGNPLLMRELLGSLAAEGVAPAAAALERIDALGPQAVGPSVKRTLMRLPESTRSVAGSLAVLGPGAERRHTMLLAGLPEDEFARAADALAGANLVGGDQRLEFVHPLIAAAVYEMIPTAERALAHARAARVLSDAGAPTAAIAAQLLRCDPLGEPWVIQRLRDAAREARARGVPEAAVRYLRRALAEPGAAGDAELLLALGIAEARAGDPEAVDLLRRAFESAQEQAVWLRAARECSLAAVWPGRFTDMVEILDRAIARVGPRDPSLVLSLDTAVALGAMLDREVVTVARERIDRMRSAGPGEHDSPVETIVALATWAAFSNHSAEEASRLIDAALRRTPRGPITTAHAAHVFWTLLMIEDFERALRLIGESVDARARGGYLMSLGTSSIFATWAHYRSGDIAAAEAASVAARRLPTPDVMGRLAAATLADTLLERGEIAEAETILSGPGDPGKAEGTIHHAYLLHALGRVLAAQGKHEQALAALRDAGMRFRDGGWISPAVGSWRSDTALILRAEDEREEALALVAEEVQLARAFGRPRALGIALRSQGVVEGGRSGIAILADAVSVLEPSDARLEYARALVDLGAALRRANQRVRARQPLSEGARIAARCGATALVERAHQELLASGARPRRFGPEMRDALTPSERRVADLAASGMTNREIAQALFITLRTVETHLTHVYRKLDVTTREQLPAALTTATAIT